MADAENPVLRIYCVCGQKMKVTGALFGRPGKCVACRQKIRIPRLDELEEGVTEIHLKDHPEYLRKAPRRASAAAESAKSAGKEVVLRKREDGEEVASAAEEEEHVELGDDSRNVSTVPLDVLEPLRTIASLEYKLGRQLKKLDEDDTAYAEVQGRMARLDHVRHDLEEKMRQMLMEVAIELATVQDKIAQTQLSTRIGEIGFDEFRQEIYRQRSRRDRLERRQHNLRGWLAANSLELSGGYLDLPPEAAPEDGFAIPIPQEEKSTVPLVDVHTAGLREAFATRAKAERKRAEIRKIANDPNNTRRWKTDRLNAHSEELYSDANIRFCQDRLKLLHTDYTEDLETLAAQSDLIRARMQSGQMERNAYDKEQKKISRARADLKKALSIVDRALTANAAEDVPQPKGTFLARLADVEREPVVVADLPAWLMRVSAALVFVGVWLPLVGSFGYPGHVPFICAAAAAGALTGVSFMQEPVSRVVGLAAVWLLSIFAFVWLIRLGYYEPGPAASAFRSGPALWLRPGFLVLMIAFGLTFGAVVLGMRQVGQGIAGSVGVAVAGLFLVSLAGTDVFGTYQPEPLLNVGFKPMTGAEGQFTEIRIENDGGRAMYLTPVTTTARSGYEFFIERQIGANSWSEVGRTRWPAASAAPLEIAAGSSLTKSYSLSGGNYRAVLIGHEKSVSLEEHFTAPEIEQAEEPDPKPEVPVVSIQEPETPPEISAAEPAEPSEPVDAEPPPQQPGTTVSFQGAGRTSAGRYRLIFQVSPTDASPRRVFSEVGQELAEGWEIRLYDPNNGTVTLNLEDATIVLRTGDSEFLPSR